MLTRCCFCPFVLLTGCHPTALVTRWFTVRATNLREHFLPSGNFYFNLHSFLLLLSWLLSTSKSAGLHAVIRNTPLQTMRSDKFGSQLDRKSKTCFFNFLNLYIFWIKRGKILISQLSPTKFRYFVDQNGPKRESHDNEFW